MQKVEGGFPKEERTSVTPITKMILSRRSKEGLLTREGTKSQIGKEQKLKIHEKKKGSKRRFRNRRKTSPKPAGKKKRRKKK